MADYLRFTPAEFQALSRASHPLPPGRHLRTFQNVLVDALRANNPDLASRIAAFREPQVRILLGHLKTTIDREMPDASNPGTEPKREVCRLSFQEWRVLAQACTVIFLRGESPSSMKDSLLKEIAEDAPGLAAKLARLTDEQLAYLCQEVKSGRRCCD